MKTFRTVVFLMLSISCLNILAADAQPTASTYDNPLAYIGADGNIYITSIDGTAVTRITSEGSPRGYGFSDDTAFGKLRWAPDGTKLASSSGARLHVTMSGQATQMLLPDLKIGYGISSWSPDGKQIAFIAGGGGSTCCNELDVLTLGEDTFHKLADIPGGFVADGIPPEEVFWEFSDEREQNVFIDSYSLDWTPAGFALSHNNLDDPANSYLLSLNGKATLWKNNLIGLLVSRNKALGVGQPQSDSSDSRPSIVDLPTGNVTPLAITPHTDIIAWTADSKAVIYETAVLLEHASFDTSDHMSPDHDNYTLTLWIQSLDGGKPRKLFEHRGYAIGAVTVSSDNSTVAFSLISNTAFDKNEPDLQIIAMPLAGGPANWIAIGGSPAFGQGSFNAVPASESTDLAQPITCPKALVSRLKVGQRARVTPGDPNNLRTRPVNGDLVRILRGGSIFLVLDGPTCASDGLAWWKVNYQGNVGWTVEGDRKSYWLQP